MDVITDVYHNPVLRMPNRGRSPSILFLEYMNYGDLIMLRYEKRQMTLDICPLLHPKK